MGKACCKVGNVIERRDLDSGSSVDDIDEYLVTRWLGEDGYTELGLRPLTDWFNRRILRDAYLENGRSTTETRIESEYEALAGDDDITRGEVVDDLGTDGIDGQQLIDDFVSKSTLQRHLTNCLDVRKRRESRSDGDWERQTIEHAQGVLREKVEAALQSLENKEMLPGATTATVETPVVLRCPECNTRVRFKTARERGYICKSHLGTAETVGNTDRD